MSAQGIFDSVKEWWGSIDLEKWFGASSADAIQVAIYFVSFFAIGFLFKKYLKLIFFSILIAILLVKGLEYYKVLDIDWERFNFLVGLEPTETLGGVAGKCVEWIKINIVVAVSSLLGFFVGYKLG